MGVGETMNEGPQQAVLQLMVIGYIRIVMQCSQLVLTTYINH